MSWKRYHCWLLACDRCRDGWSAYEDEPHFELKDDLVKYAQSKGWVFTGERALCVDCFAVETCALTGHVWGRWTRLDRGGVVGSEPQVTWLRICRICSIGESDPPPRSS